MGKAATLVNGRQLFQQFFIPLPQGGSNWNLSNISPVEKFEILNIFPIQMRREANLTSP